MKIKSILLENIGQFPHLEIKFAPFGDKKFNNTIIIGNNGAGKSTILESISLALSWFVARVKSEKGGGIPIQELRIKNDYPSAAITVEVSDKSRDFSWTLSKARKGRKNEKGTHLEDLTKLANSYRTDYASNSNLSFPIITFYDANRGVLDIPLKIRGKHTFEQLDGYDNSLRGIVDYRRFFEWYREREDAENESKIRFLSNIDFNITVDKWSEKLASFADLQLEAVRNALNVFLPELKNIRVERKPRLHVAVEKNGQHLNVEQLSQGEKLTMALVGDIARRLAIMNPGLKDVLTGYGVVLIDEAELHLHPKWQRLLVERLSKTFKNCQFIFTTHSPLLISDYKNVLCYSLDNGELTEIDDLYGSDVNQVLLDAMDTDIRNKDIQENIDRLRDELQHKNSTKAKKIFEELEKELPENHIELIKSRLLLKRFDLLK